MSRNQPQQSQPPSQSQVQVQVTVSVNEQRRNENHQPMAVNQLNSQLKHLQLNQTTHAHQPHQQPLISLQSHDHGPGPASHQQQQQFQSPAKNYGAFGGGLFFQPPSPQQELPQPQQSHTSQFPSSHQSTGPSGGAPVQGKSILNEVLALMHQPNAPQTANQPNQQQAPIHQQQQPNPSNILHLSPKMPDVRWQPNQLPLNSIPTGFPSQPSTQQLRPPMMNRPIGPMGNMPPGFGNNNMPKPPPGFQANGPPGFGPSFGFPMNMQQQPISLNPSQPSLNSSMAPPPPLASQSQLTSPFIPPSLQHDSHVQCSLCRVIVPNNPQALFQHDHSQQHLANERSQQQVMMQRALPNLQQQQQSQSSSSTTPTQSPPLNGSASASPDSSPNLGPTTPSFDLTSMQNQLRSFMLASEEAKKAGLPAPAMDPEFANQLKMMQESMQRQQQKGQKGGKSSPSSSTSSSTAGPNTFASSAGPFPTRQALIAACAAIHPLQLKRLPQNRPITNIPINLEFDLQAMLQTLQPDPTTFERREEIRVSCEKLVQQAWGVENCSVKLFGSSVNTLCETNSDVDLCLAIQSINGVPPDKPAIVEKIALLFKPYFKDILALPKARVPIVKFVSNKYNLHCDIGINNYLACKNSELIRDYMNLDPRARDLCLLIKHWAKMRKINDPYRGTLSSYCYVMMVIHYLQNPLHCQPPVLPCLQTYGRTEATSEQIESMQIDGFDCWYYTDIDKLKGFGRANQASLAELLIGFFRLYSGEFDFKEMVVSIRTALYLEKKKKVWGESGKKDRQLFCVEDPFDVSHNLARGCDANALYEIRGEFQRAHRLLVQEGKSVYELCAIYTKEWRGA